MACSLTNLKDLEIFREESVKKRKELQKSHSLKDIIIKFAKHQTKIINLPRGGQIVETSAGYIQLGIPPESVKDPMILGLDIPEYYIIPTNRFNKKLGLVVADFEFPAYFQYFCNKCNQVTLICTKEAEKAIKIAFQETLLGPKNPSEFIDQDFHQTFPKDKRPQFEKELPEFAINPFTKKPFEIKDLLKFCLFDEKTNIASIENTKIQIEKIDGKFNFLDSGRTIASLKDDVQIPLTENMKRVEIADMNFEKMAEEKVPEEEKEEVEVKYKIED